MKANLVYITSHSHDSYELRVGALTIPFTSFSAAFAWVLQNQQRIIDGGIDLP